MEVYVIFMVNDIDDISEILTVTQYFYQAENFLKESGFEKDCEGNWRYNTNKISDRAQAYIERQKVKGLD